MATQDYMLPFLNVLIVLTLLLVIIRIITQNYRSFSHHEVPILVALAFFFVMLSLGVKGSLDARLVETINGTWISYAMLMTLTRLSTLLLYQYIFSSVISPLSIAILHTCNLAWGVVTMVLTFPGLITADQFGAFFLATGLTNMILDFVTVTYGVVLAKNAQVVLSKKTSLIALFSLPYLSCIASAVRVCISRQLDVTDLSGSIVGPFIAACVESFVALAGFILACGARPLYRLSSQAHRYLSSRLSRIHLGGSSHAEVKIGYHYGSRPQRNTIVQETEIPPESKWLKDQQQLQHQHQQDHSHAHLDDKAMIVCAQGGALRTGTLSLLDADLDGSEASDALPFPATPSPPPPCHHRRESSSFSSSGRGDEEAGKPLPAPPGWV